MKCSACRNNINPVEMSKARYIYVEGKLSEVLHHKCFTIRERGKLLKAAQREGAPTAYEAKAAHKNADDDEEEVPQAWSDWREPMTGEV